MQKRKADEAVAKAASEANRKEVLTFFEDSEIKKLLAIPYPEAAQLKADLNAIIWSTFENNSLVFKKSGNNNLILIKTDKGARAGAYFKFSNKELLGNKKEKIIDLTKFYTLDKISDDDSYFYSFTESDEISGTGIVSLKAAEENSFKMDLTKVFLLHSFQF